MQGIDLAEGVCSKRLFINFFKGGIGIKQKLLLTFLLAVSMMFLGNTGCEPPEPQPVDQFNPDLEYGEMTDERDGQTYKTIEIGTQTWMAENLKYLPEVSPSAGGAYTEPYYYVYNYIGTSVSEAKATNKFNTYGALYNWPAALTACPPGWHLPSDAEWTALITYLDPSADPDVWGSQSYVAGGKMKSTPLWSSPNTGATNESGWSGLPGGRRYDIGHFFNLGRSGNWWSASEGNADSAWYRNLNYYNGNVYRDGSNKDYGISVRCLRD